MQPHEETPPAYGVCAVEIDAEYRARAKVIFKDLRAQVLYC
jgi:hypothetical protein